MSGKKRRDKKRDPSTFQRLSKAGGTALALGAGAVFLHDTKAGQKFFREVRPALGESTKNFKKDLSKINKRSLLEIGNTFEKSFSHENFQKTMLKKKNEKLDVNPMTSSLYRQLLNKTQLIKASGHGVDSELPQDHKDKVMSFITNKIHDEQIKGKRDDIKKSNISQIVKSVFDDMSDTGLNNELINEKIDKTLKKAKLSQEEKFEILSTINEVKKNVYTPNEISSHVARNQKLKQDIEEIYYSSDLADFNKNIYNRIDNFSKKVFGASINSEKLITGSESVKVKEFIKNYDKISEQVNVQDFEFKVKSDGPSSKNTEMFNFLDELHELTKHNKEAYNMPVSKGLRKTIDENGEVLYFNSQDNVNALNKAKNKFKETLPYKIMFKFFDDKDQDKNIFISRSGYKSSMVSHIKLDGQESEEALENIENNISSSLSFFINGKTYFTHEKDGVLTIDKENAIDSKLLRGYKKREYYSTLGKEDYIYPEAYDSKIAKMLDLNQNGEFNIFNNIKRAFHKFNDKDWEFNSIENVENVYTSGLSPATYVNEILKYSFVDEESAPVALTRTLSQLHKDEIITSKKLASNIKGVTNDTLEQLLESNLIDDKSKKMISALLSEDMMEYLQVATHSEYDTGILSDVKNEKLNVLLNKWMTSTDNALNSREDIVSKGFRIPLLEMPLDENNQLDMFGQLRIETVKNIILELDDDVNGDNLFGFIDDLKLSDKEKYTLKDISVSALFDKNTKVHSIGAYSSDLGTIYGNNTFSRTLSNNPLMMSHFEANIGEAKSKFGPLSKGSTYNLNEKYYDTEEDYAIIKKSSIGKILTFDLNEGIKFSGQALEDTAKELIAGRNSPENITDLTLGLRHLYTRLNYGIQEVGLGLSDESLGSTQDVIKNMMLKRVLPVMAVGTGLDVLDYEAQKLTGVSLGGAVANSMANIDLGARGILDSTHLSSAFNFFAESSVISEYYTGDRKFNTQEEERQWYEEGYSPVRKGRFWSFGSSSEYRGGDVTYYQPNFLKRAHSNYHDVGVYGSIDEKWAHSLIPTPQHPLSTLRAVLDPYWLERKHLKENDRPYPLSSKMFSEGTFWGSVLNPTIGEAIKPVKMLPEARRRLGRNGIDAKDSIERLNTKIKQRGNRNDDLIIVDGTDIRNGEYVPYGNPEIDEVNLSIQNGRLSAKGTNFLNSVDDIREYEAPDGISFTEEQNNFQGQISRRQQRVITKTEKFIQEMQGSQGVDEKGTSTAISIIQSLNDNIRKDSRHINSTINNPTRDEGTYVYHNLVNEKINSNESYYQRFEAKKMVNKSTYADYKKDFIHSQQQVHGMYGFLANALLGSNAYSYRYENAGQMSSFTRSFWDSNIGGLGGGVMEIARRFFPSEDRSRININPLRNNMPNWIPDSYHFGRLGCRIKITRIAGNSLELQIPTMHSNVA